MSFVAGENLKGDPKVIEGLNEVLVGELTAINQYFLHAKMCENWGYTKLAGKMRAESIDEMKHADILADRILLLEGMPNFQKLGRLRIGETPMEQLKSDLELENVAIPLLKSVIGTCFEVVDHVSREILEKILAEEESHADWLETQLSMIGDMGIENYLTLQA